MAGILRPGEIGLRRALGATRGHIRTQFLAEAVLLALAGGIAGTAIGALAPAFYAHLKGWAVVIPVQAWAGGLAAALPIGAIAGLWPALRAARLSPPRPCGRSDLAKLSRARPQGPGPGGYLIMLPPGSPPACGGSPGTAAGQPRARACSWL